MIKPKTNTDWSDCVKNRWKGINGFGTKATRGSGHFAGVEKKSGLLYVSLPTLTVYRRYCDREYVPTGGKWQWKDFFPPDLQTNSLTSLGVSLSQTHTHTHIQRRCSSLLCLLSLPLEGQGKIRSVDGWCGGGRLWGCSIVGSVGPLSVSCNRVWEHESDTNKRS